MESYIIVGGGLAGLTAANALAGRGDRVTVLEQSERLGGRATTREEQGYRFNLGPHALYRGGRAMRTRHDWKVAIRGHVPDVSRQSFLVYEGRKYDFFTGAGGILHTPLFRWSEKIEAVRMFTSLTRGSTLRGELMDHWLRRHTRSERVRALGAAIIRVSTYAADHARLSARAALDQFRLARRNGVLYVDDGWQTLVDGLANRARSLGVQIRTGQLVESLKALDASAVILAVPPRAVEQIAGGRLPVLRSVRAATLELGIRTLPEGAARFALGLDRPLYFSQHSAGTIYVAKYLTDTDDNANAQVELEGFADLAMPGWRQHADVVRFLPSLTVTHAIAAPDGRPDVDAAGIDGVALAGDWIGPEGMLADAAVASALRAAAMVQRRKVKAA